MKNCKIKKRFVSIKRWRQLVKTDKYWLKDWPHFNVLGRGVVEIVFVRGKPLINIHELGHLYHWIEEGCQLKGNYEKCPRKFREIKAWQLGLRCLKPRIKKLNKRWLARTVFNSYMWAKKICVPIVYVG